ncbi:MAG: hypothetical protein U5S82_15990 [Gammaproteobacteria bacterium]|nr:hypothetical protein [Gammaproteobacteria bacterium]
MSICVRFGRRIWPFTIVVFVAGFSAFLTWLTLASAGVAAHVNFGWTTAVFLGVVTLLLVYVINCLRRHCAGGSRDSGSSQDAPVSRPSSSGGA